MSGWLAGTPSPPRTAGGKRIPLVVTAVPSYCTSDVTWQQVSASVTISVVLYCKEGASELKSIIVHLEFLGKIGREDQNRKRDNGLPAAAFSAGTDVE